MNITPDIKDLILSNKAVLKDALALIDKNAQGICFITDDKNKLTGVLTDGDIRRCILNGTSLDTVVEKVMQTKFTFLPVTPPQDIIQSNPSNQIRHSPLVDENNVPVDYACFSKMHR